MQSLTLVQLVIDIPAALRAVPHLSPVGRSDETLVVKTLLTEGLGGPVLRPWRIVGQHGGQLTVLGYTGGLAADALRQRLALATPAQQAALTVVGSTAVPCLATGDRLRFRIRLVPLISVTGAGTRDAYTYACRKAGTARGIDRAAVYARYLSERLTGAVLEATALDGFRLAPLVRRKGHSWSQGRFPAADLSGVLSVADPADFMRTLASGLGRMRAYGFGMLRLEAG